MSGDHEHEHDPAEMTVEEQVELLKAQPDEGQTDNSPDPNLEQPPQDADWDPNTDPNVETVPPEELV